MRRLQERLAGTDLEATPPAPAKTPTGLPLVNLQDRMAASRVKREGGAIRAALEWCFDELDTDSSGFIEDAEGLMLAKYLGAAEYAKAWQAMKLEMDTDGDGRVSLDEYVDWMMRSGRCSTLQQAHQLKAELQLKMSGRAGKGVPHRKPRAEPDLEQRLEQLIKKLRDEGVEGVDPSEARRVLTAEGGHVGRALLQLKPKKKTQKTKNQEHNEAIYRELAEIEAKRAAGTLTAQEEWDYDEREMGLYRCLIDEKLGF